MLIFATIGYAELDCENIADLGHNRRLSRYPAASSSLLKACQLNQRPLIDNQQICAAIKYADRRVFRRDYWRTCRTSFHLWRSQIAAVNDRGEFARFIAAGRECYP